MQVSSSSVYGDAKTPFSEKDDQFKPKSFYGYSKLLNENIAKEFLPKTQYIQYRAKILQFTENMGVLIWLTFFFLKNILSEKPITLFNNGELARDMTHIDDILSGIESTSL